MNLATEFSDLGHCLFGYNNKQIGLIVLNGMMLHCVDDQIMTFRICLKVFAQKKQWKELKRCGCILPANLDRALMLLNTKLDWAQAHTKSLGLVCIGALDICDFVLLQEDLFFCSVEVQFRISSCGTSQHERHVSPSKSISSHS